VLETDLDFFPGKGSWDPHISRLHAIHLFKADYNLLLKWFGPNGFTKHAKDNQQLTNYQYGS